MGILSASCNKDVGSVDPLLGSLVNDFIRLEHSLGHGGRARAYAARDERTGEVRAVKVALHARNTSLELEATMLRRAESPDIGTLYDYGLLADGRPFIVRNLVDGEALNTLRRRWHCSVECALTIGARVGSLLNALHEKAIVHRDVKPHNIIVPINKGVPAFSAATLIDFDVACVLTQRLATGHLCAEPGFVFGTPTYMAPEIMLGRAATRATDIYSLGITMYKLIYGREPMSDEAFEQVPIGEGMPRVFMGPLVLRKLSEDVVVTGADSVPYGVRQLIQAMLRRDPSNRPSLQDEVIPQCQLALSHLH
jgi:serine/threonine-protein kinase